jgi:hypothetical protein
MMRGLVGIALGWCLIVGANAQPQADVTTDQELFAAYCLGVIIAAESDGSLISFIEETSGRDEAQQTKERYRQKRSRFLGYLTARGLLSGTRGVSATTGALLAKERGLVDSPRCSAKVHACVDKFASKRPYVQKNIDDCRDEEDACRKSARCYDDDRLPF